MRRLVARFAGGLVVENVGGFEVEVVADAIDAGEIASVEGGAVALVFGDCDRGLLFHTTLVLQGCTERKEIGAQRGPSRLPSFLGASRAKQRARRREISHVRSK